ncbi:hypothetical protein VTN49DRAFT_4466 [Thermomyces lanuginosus]|uniref:uncharacterized protein n=1 Tax=Thermomyces lanuginosus TaxID=5541 RepID=UPI0037444A83
MSPPPPPVHSSNALLLCLNVFSGNPQCHIPALDNKIACSCLNECTIPPHATNNGRKMVRSQAKFHRAAMNESGRASPALGCWEGRPTPSPACGGK